MLSDWTLVAYPAALLLASALPFDAIRSLVTTGWGSLTVQKLIVVVAIVAWMTQGWRAMPRPEDWRALLPTLVFIVLALTSAYLAADYADDAVRFTTRLLICAFAFFLGLRISRNDDKHARALLWALVIGGAASAVLGLTEALCWPQLDPLLGLFKVAPTRVGGELRVSASFQYATIAAMYFEMLVPLAIVLSAMARGRALRIAATAVAAICTANVVLSLTRAGTLTLAVVLATLAVVAFINIKWRSLLVPTIASGVVLLGGVILLLVRDPVFDLRLVTESDADWYGATYAAPAAITAGPTLSITIALDVRNDGRMTWTSSEKHPFALGYRWLTADGSGVLDVPTGEVVLYQDVEPGSMIHLHPTVVVPDLPTGTYRLGWGMLQRGVLQFYERGWADAETTVQISRGPEAGTGMMPSVAPRDDSEAPWVVGRLDLWGAALRLTSAHPLLGVGPDNFRHFYGAELGLEAWDERVQANNLYLEVLADLGGLGFLALAWIVIAPLRACVGAIRGANPAAATFRSQPRSIDETPNHPSSGNDQAVAPKRSASQPYVALGVALAIAAFLVHGLLDAFLAFTPTALLFWMLLGIGSAQKPQVSGR